MFENANVMLIRLCGILKALYVAVNFVEKHSSHNQDLNNILVKDIDAFLDDKDLVLSKQRFLISAQIVTNAYDLLDYFNKHKLVMAGYEFDVHASLNQTIKLLVENVLKTPKVEIKTVKGWNK